MVTTLSAHRSSGVDQCKQVDAETHGVPLGPLWLFQSHGSCFPSQNTSRSGHWEKSTIYTERETLMLSNISRSRSLPGLRGKPARSSRVESKPVEADLFVQRARTSQDQLQGAFAELSPTSEGNSAQEAQVAVKRENSILGRSLSHTKGTVLSVSSVVRHVVESLSAIQQPVS